MEKKELENEAEKKCKLNDQIHRDCFVDGYIKAAEPREKRIAKLKAQIEQMKCCFNCKHSRTKYEHCRTDKHEKWEIKENAR